MLDQYFGPAILPVFEQGPLAPHLQGFCGWLRGQGYARVSVRRYVLQASHLSRWLESQGLGLGRGLRGDAAAFRRRHLPACRCELVGLRHDRFYGSLERLAEYLTLAGLELDRKPPRICDPFLVQEYLDDLRDCRGLGEGTIALHRWNLLKFLDWLGSDAAPERLHLLTDCRIEDFCLRFGRDRGRSQRHAMQGTLRTFLAYCLKRGLIRRDLAGAVPILRSYSLSSVPRAISEADAKRVLDGIDTSRPAGLRDRAIFQILYSYGVRGVQVCTLRLDDVVWEQSRIRFPPMKGGRGLDLPLTVEAGNRLLDYLRRGRPPSPRPEVFLGIRAPYGPLSRASLTHMAAQRMRAAGIPAPLRTHAFRHAFACRMLRRGRPLKAIADLLGHRALQTTFIYAKVDFRTLSEAALPWPEEAS